MDLTNGVIGEPGGKGSFKRSLEFSFKYQSLLVLQVLLAGLCIIGSGFFVHFMDGKNNASTRLSKFVQPTATLNIISSVYTFCLGAAISNATAISWYRTAIRRTKIENLSDIWERGTSGVWGFCKTVLRHADGYSTSREAVILAFTAFVIAVTNFLSGPLLQQSMNVQSHEMVTNRTMMMDIREKIPDGWTGSIDVTKPGNISFRPDFLLIMQQWYQNKPITTKPEHGYSCLGSCIGDVSGAGIIWNTSRATDIVHLDDGFRNGSVAFATNFDRFDNEWGYPTLRVVAKYVTEVDNSCVANITSDTYNISIATIRYPVIIVNETVKLNISQLHLVSQNQTYKPLKSTGDSTSAKPDWGAGPLAALEGFANSFFLSSATVDYNGTTRKYDVDMKGILARLYYDTNDTHYDSITSCAYQFASPIEGILNAFHEVTFRTALKSNNGTTANFTVEETVMAPFYHVQRSFWISALIIMSFALMILFFPIFGLLSHKWRGKQNSGVNEPPAWSSSQLHPIKHISEIRHDLSLNPIKVARAFYFPITPEGDFFGMDVQYKWKKDGEEWQMPVEHSVPPPSVNYVMNPPVTPSHYTATPESV